MRLVCLKLFFLSHIYFIVLTQREVRETVFLCEYHVLWSSISRSDADLRGNIRRNFSEDGSPVTLQLMAKVRHLNRVLVATRRGASCSCMRECWGLRVAGRAGNCVRKVMVRYLFVMTCLGICVEFERYSYLLSEKLYHYLNS